MVHNFAKKKKFELAINQPKVILMSSLHSRWTKLSIQQLSKPNDLGYIFIRLPTSPLEKVHIILSRT